MFFLIGLIGFLALSYGITAIIMKKYGATQEKSVGGRYQKVPIDLPFKAPAVLIGLALFIVSLVITKVGAQEVGVLITPKGVVEKDFTTGWHLIAPWNDLQMMDKTVWVYTFTNKADEGQKKTTDAIWTPTKDGIKMGLDISISWAIDPKYAWWIYANVSEADGGVEGKYMWIEENFIRAKTKSVLALTVSNYTPIEVYSNKRQDIQDVTFKKLGEELLVYHLILRQIDIREVFYNPEYEQAINNKKLAEQEALRLLEVTKQKEELLKQSRIEKDIVIQAAQGQAEALKITGQSISSNPKIIQLEWIKRWSGVLPTVIAGSNSAFLLNLPSQDK
jgi:regulator of protease activity HflC (stomatin/prohibitin superfamily)